MRPHNGLNYTRLAAARPSRHFLRATGYQKVLRIRSGDLSVAQTLYMPIALTIAVIISMFAMPLALHTYAGKRWEVFWTWETFRVSNTRHFIQFILVMLELNLAQGLVIIESTLVFVGNLLNNKWNIFKKKMFFIVFLSFILAWPLRIYIDATI